MDELIAAQEMMLDAIFSHGASAVNYNGLKNG
jgi:hypothetical protein